MTPAPGAARRPPASPRGFTLVEVLLAFAIFATVLVVLLSAFTGAERARDILSDRSRGYRQVRASLDRIGTELV